MQESWIQSPRKEDPLEKGMATQFIILAWRISLAGYSPWGCQELDTTEWLTHHEMIITMNSVTIHLHMKKWNF